MILLLLCALNAPFQRGMWVRASCLVFPDSLPKIIAVAEDMGVTDIYAQVVVSGYAYYRSIILPRSQYLSRMSGTEYDPLQALIDAAQGRSIRVHAWVNCFVVWSLKDPPDSTRHVFYQHPDWFITDVRGRSLHDYPYPEWDNWGLEGLFLDPAQPKVREYLKSIGAELSRQYKLAGVHLDFIRYPGTLWGLADLDTNDLFAGPEADTLRWLELARYPRLSFYLRWLVWRMWPMNRERERRVLEAVKAIRDGVADRPLKDGCALTAAVFCNPSLARWRYDQDWPDWGLLLDYPVIMSYTRDVGFFSDILDYTRLRRPDAVYGIGLIWPGMEAEAWWEERQARERGGKGVCYFEYTTLDTLVDREKLKGDVMVRPESLTFDSSRYALLGNAFADTASPPLVGAGEKLLPWEQEYEFAAYLFSLSLNPAVDLGRLGLDRQSFLRRLHDDVCAFAALDRLIFPLGDELIEPPARVADFEFFPWPADSPLAANDRAARVKKLSRRATVYPRAMDKFSRAVFSAPLNERTTCAAAEGIYVFKVRKAIAGGRKVKRERVKPDLLPAYRNWTIKSRFWALTRSP